MEPNSASAGAAVHDRVLYSRPVKWREFQFIQHPEFKDISPDEFQKLVQSILKEDFVESFKVWLEPATGITYCLDGFHRCQALEFIVEHKLATVPETFTGDYMDCASREEAARLVLIYSSRYARVQEQGLYEFLNINNLNLGDVSAHIDIPDIDLSVFERNFFDTSLPPDDSTPASRAGNLVRKFGIPPFSVLDTRQGYWRDRKHEWVALGMKSELGRGNTMESLASAYKVRQVADSNGTLSKDDVEVPTWTVTSIFDPVLAEMSYRWFCPAGGTILDPFAGGSVRGVVAGALGYNYIGNDLRQEQIEANREQWAEISQKLQQAGVGTGTVAWTVGDSIHINQLTGNEPADLLFSCPPYADLEVYSDLPEDISNMQYSDFLQAYRQIIHNSLDQLKPDRFAVFVVGDLRDEQGFYRNFTGDTVAAFCSYPGVHLYNEMVLVNVAGTLPIRTGKQFNAGRKAGKMHQNVYVFYKGDPSKIRENFGDVEITEIPSEETQTA